MTPALIADDEPPLVRALQTQLATAWPDLRVVATARNGVEAAALIAQHTPDLAFLDIQMPGLTELEVAQGIEGPTRWSSSRPTTSTPACRQPPPST